MQKASATADAFLFIGKCDYFILTDTNNDCNNQ